MAHVVSCDAAQARAAEREEDRRWGRREAVLDKRDQRPRRAAGEFHTEHAELDPHRRERLYAIYAAAHELPAEEIALDLVLALPEVRERIENAQRLAEHEVREYRAMRAHALERQRACGLGQ